MSYNLKFTGKQVEDLLDSIQDKVDKVAGKVLSTNDYTDEEREKLAGLENYPKP